MLPKRIRPFIVPPLLLVLLFFSIILLINFWLQDPEVQSYFVKRLSEATGFPIRTEKIELNLWGGIGLIVQGLEAESNQGKTNLTASRVRIIFDSGQLIRGRISPIKIYLSGFRFELGRGVQGCSFPSGESGGAVPLPVFWIPGLERLAMDDGQIVVGGRCFDLEEFSCDVTGTSGVDSLILKVSSYGLLGFRDKKIPVSLRGTVSQGEKTPEKPKIDLALMAEKIPLTWIPWPEEVPFREGSLKVGLDIKGSPGNPFNITGKASLEAVRFSVIEAQRAKAYDLPSLSLDFKSLIDGSVIRVPAMTLKTAGLVLGINLDLDLTDRENPLFQITAKSPHFTLETCLRYLPTPLVPRWVEQHLIPLITAGDIRLDELSFKGRPDQFKAMHLPENRSIMGLRFRCTNFQLRDEKAGEPFRAVSADVTLKEGTFSISRLQADFGQSTIRSGSLDISTVFSAHSRYRSSLEGAFELKELIKQLQVDLVPDRERPRFYGPLTPGGKMSMRATIRYQDDWDYPRIEEGEFRFQDCSIDRRLSVYPFLVKEALFLIDEKGQNRFQGQGSWGKTTFQVNGAFFLDGKRFYFQQADTTAALDMQEMIPLFYGIPGFPLSFSRPVALDINIKREMESWSCRGALNLEGVVLETENFSIDPPGTDDRISFDVNFGPGGQTTIHKLLLSLRKSTLEMSGSYNFGLKEFSRLKVSIPSFSLGDLGLGIKKMNVQAAGNLGGHLVIRIDRKNPLGTRVTGRMTGEKLVIFPGSIPYLIEDGHFKADFVGSRVTIPTLGFRIGESTIKAGGDLQGWDGLRGNIWVISDFFDATGLLGDSKAAGSEKGRSLLEQLMKKAPTTDPPRLLDKSDIHVDLDIQKGRWKGLAWGPLTAHMDFKEDKLYIRESKLLMKHGDLQIKGHLERGENHGILLSSQIQLADQPVEALLEALDIQRFSLEGGLTLEALLTMRGRNKSELISGMSGFSEISIRNGVIRKSSALLKILEFLSLQKIFTRIPKDIPKEGFYFESIQGHALIDKGRLKTEDAVMRSPIINAVGSGTIQLADERVDFDLGIQPLETLDTVVSKIPILGYILTGKDKKLLTYYFRVEGPLSGQGPEVSYIPFKNLGKGTASTLKRLFLTPLRLLKNIPRPGGPGAGLPESEDEDE